MLPQLGRVSTELLAHADLGEQVVDVAVGLAGAGDDGHLAREACCRRPGRRPGAGSDAPMAPIKRLVPRGVVGSGQPLAQEERAARGAGAHQDAGDRSVHAGIFGGLIAKVNCIFKIN
jgi:hypothetical protein